MYKPIDADVIIVGGGIAGLSAAYHLSLKEPSLTTIILEGSGRIGGRIYSVPLLVEASNAVSYFDLGAQWICKKQTHLLKMLDALGIQYKTPNKKGKIILQYQRVYACSKHIQGNFPFLTISEKLQLSKFIIKVELWAHILKQKDYSKYTKGLSEKTLERFIRDTVSSDAVYAIIDHMVFSNCGVRPHQVSALFYIFFCVSTKGIAYQLPTEKNTFLDFKIKGGAQTICDKIIEIIGRESVVSDEPVKSVSIYPKYVEIVSKHTIYRCFNVIVAVSPKDILNINFSPSLSNEHIEALSKITSNTVTNFVATYERDFWKDLNLSGECYIFDRSDSNGPIDFCTDISSPGRVAISGKIFQGEVIKKELPIYKGAVLTQLAKYFGKEALNPLDYCERSWTDYSCHMVGWDLGNENYIKEVSQPYDRMFFAGAETTVEWYGCLAGAVHSGARAAFESLYYLRPAVLNSSDLSVISPTRRIELTPTTDIYGKPLFTAANNWKLIASVCVVVLAALWRLQRGYFFRAQ